MPKNRRAAALILALCLLTACSAPAPEPEEPERAESEPLVEYIELGELVDAHYFASDGESLPVHLRRAEHRLHTLDLRP